MKRQDRLHREATARFGRRAVVLGGLQLGFAGLLGLRMRQLQVREADKYRLLAEENRVNIRLLAPSRGMIFDRNGVELARNEQNYKISIIREEVGNVDATLARLAQLLRLSDEDVEQARIYLQRHSSFVPVTVADFLTWEQISAVAVNTPALPGVSTEAGQSRAYPLGEDTAHVVGYVGPVSDYDLSRIENPDPLFQIPRFQIGKSGVENKFEETLRGKAGSRRIEVNAAGRVMRELDRQEGRPGSDLQLTIDARLQNFARVRLGTESASAVVLDVETGDIVTAASAPSFDPNKFVRGISSPDYSALLNNDHRPLQGKAVQGAYPPGSTFKMVTALAALEDGVIDPDDHIFCPGYMQLGNRRFHCWKRGGHGRVDLKKSLLKSCDVYYYDLSQRVGIEKISAMARRLGIGVPIDIPMSAVHSGLAPTMAWKQENRGEPWVVGDTFNSAIGQGFVLASPMQLAVMTSRIATGRTITPRLIRTINGAEQGPYGGGLLDVNPAHLEKVREGMFSVVNERGGTAYRSRIIADTMRMAGKTGTSQVSSNIVDNDEVPWEQRDHALFVAFAPYDAPKYAVSVVVEHGGGGSRTAAPVARDIMAFALNNGYPPEEAYPVGARQHLKDLQDTLEILGPESLRPESNRA